MFESWNVHFFHLEWEFDEFAVRLCWGKWFNSGWNEKHNGQHWWGVTICHAGGELLRDHAPFLKLIWNKEYMFAWWILIGGRQSILSSPKWQGIHFIPQLHDSSRSIIVFIATLLYLQYGHLLQTCVLAPLWQLGRSCQRCRKPVRSWRKEKMMLRRRQFYPICVAWREWMHVWHACFQESVRGSNLFLKVTGLQTSSPRNSKSSRQRYCIYLCITSLLCTTQSERIWDEN